MSVAVLPRTLARDVRAGEEVRLQGERLTAQLVGAPNLRWATLFPRDRRRLEP
ncbi:MAG: hypothetical protein HY334_06490 [Armatimonadetes bacterium]|nr:hypothetical protein [Armatimonadota bacterium]